MNNLTKIVAAILVVAALGLAFVAWWLGSRPPPTISAVPAPITKNASQYEVVVAARALVAGKAIATDDISLVALPINPAGAYSQASSVVGKIPLIDIGAGTPITESGLASGLAVKLADGERAVAIPVDEIVGAGNRVQAGDYVDVFFTLKQGQDSEKTQSRLLMSRLHVLSYGAAVIGAAPAGSSGGVVPSQQASQPSQPAQPSQQAQPIARTAVLATPVADVNRLLLATQNGKLMLALRNPSDEAIPDLALFPTPATVLAGKRDLTRDQQEALKQPDNQAFAGMEMNGLAGDSRSSASYKPAAAPRAATGHSANNPGTVEVIRGTQRESVAF
ncbi:Flp pilus assembly protein CpaB [Collimonas fungivorans]|uniref:Flp pilus assembly protein n=1 Tax=Collimonas fungivorans (strain Ter331) TaxID=1005048 RepID=G0AIA4_COLFT|nr:Flp pilus assembly protein CpaB [Collimonas fungivorans]AEK60687.1 Flp pilus assembly protein [Collimonas fungivorans Ter331]